MNIYDETKPFGGRKITACFSDRYHTMKSLDFSQFSRTHYDKDRKTLNISFDGCSKHFDVKLLGSHEGHSSYKDLFYCEARYLKETPTSLQAKFNVLLLHELVRIQALMEADYDEMLRPLLAVDHTQPIKKPLFY